MSKILPNRFARLPGNAYTTPRSAIMPLLPFLERDQVDTFAEPCCGNWAIVTPLKLAGYRCLSATDITDGIDARTIVYDPLPDVIVSNPPYDRSRVIMRAIIDNLRKQAPTWLLLEADFAFNKGSVPLMDYCSDIVAIGRIKWIKDSKNTGTANYAWYKFGARPASMICFHPRAVSRTPTLL
jgi:hypothetical protein